MKLCFFFESKISRTQNKTINIQPETKKRKNALKSGNMMLLPNQKDHHYHPQQIFSYSSVNDKFHFILHCELI